MSVLCCVVWTLKLIKYHFITIIIITIIVKSINIVIYLLYSILFYLVVPILHYPFYSILFYAIPFYSICGLLHRYYGCIRVMLCHVMSSLPIKGG